MSQKQANLNGKHTRNWTGTMLDDGAGNRYEVLAVSVNGFHLLLRLWRVMGARYIQTSELATLPVSRANKAYGTIEPGPWLGTFPPVEVQS